MIRKIRDDLKMKDGRIKNKYTIESLGELIKIHKSIFPKLRREDAALENALLTGLIVSQEEGNEEFFDDCEKMKDTVITDYDFTDYQRDDWLLPNSTTWNKVDNNYLIIGANFINEYKIGYKELFEYFYCKELKARYDNRFFRELDERNTINLPKEIF